ncbi:MAG: hypothetical protein ACYTBZ_01545 [Planctomycetota bacterium]|jgi:hypothetical protein
MTSLLQRWLAHYDPIHRGWTPAGIANGVCTTVGFSFPRIRGGYNLRRAVDGVPVESDLMVGAAGADAATIYTFDWVSHQANTHYFYRLTAIGGGGVENFDDELVADTEFDDNGDWVGAKPNAPGDLQVAAAAGGKFVLRWTYTADGQQAEPSGFRIYNNGGSGSIDYDNAVATVVYRSGRLHFSYESGAFDNGTRVFWAVRAVTSAGVEEDNQDTVLGRAEATAPPINPPVVVGRV